MFALTSIHSIGRIEALKSRLGSTKAREKTIVANLWDRKHQEMMKGSGRRLGSLHDRTGMSSFRFSRIIRNTLGIVACLLCHQSVASHVSYLQDASFTQILAERSPELSHVFLFSLSFNFNSCLSNSIQLLLHCQAIFEGACLHLTHNSLLD